MHQKLITSACATLDRIGSKFSRDYEIEGTRQHIAMSLYALTKMHTSSILILLSKQKTNSGVALVRPAYEALLRAVWAMYKAEDNFFDEGRPGVFPNYHALVSALEEPQTLQIKDILNKVESLIGKNLRNDFTHGGLTQIFSNIAEDSFSPNFSDKEIKKICFCTVALFCGAALGMAAFSNNIELQEHVQKELDAFKSQVLTTKS